jgi:hypothetical protein
VSISDVADANASLSLTRTALGETDELEEIELPMFFVISALAATEDDAEMTELALLAIPPLAAKTDKIEAIAEASFTSPFKP